MHGKHLPSFLRKMLIFLCSEIYYCLIGCFWAVPKTFVDIVETRFSEVFSTMPQKQQYILVALGPSCELNGVQPPPSVHLLEVKDL